MLNSALDRDFAWNLRLCLSGLKKKKRLLCILRGAESCNLVKGSWSSSIFFCDAFVVVKKENYCILLK